MIFKIGDMIAFSHVSEPRQGVRDVKSMRKRSQSGETTWKKDKPQVIDTHEKYPQCLVLHDNWQGNVHCLLTNNYTQREINYLTAIIDPFFAEEKSKTDMDLKSQLQRIPQDINIVSPHDFYMRIVKPFISLYDGYRIYKPQKMLNIRVIKRYSDIERRMKTSPQTSSGQDKKSSGVVDTSTSQGSSFFQNYANNISRMRGPKLR